MDRSSDLEWMRLALELAANASILTSPNPKVGCVIVKDGLVLGRGWTQAVGQAHAEVQALNDAKLAGQDVRGATLYVSLEPCSHVGRTAACTDALIAAGIARVVAAMEDPNPKVSGQGFAKLRQAGIVIESGILADQAREMNLGFFKRMESGLPWVRLKLAASLDGFTALPNGHSQWITGLEARQDGHRWRARCDAILTGIGTVWADNPQMNVRLDDASVIVRQPRKIVVDSQLRISPKAKIFDQGGVTIAYAKKNPAAEKLLADLGVQLLYLPNAQGQVDLPALMRCLGEQEINELHVEAGGILNGAMMAQDCVDELLLYMAPKLLGKGAGLFSMAAITTLDQAQQLYFHEITQIGETMRILARVSCK